MSSELATVAADVETFLKANLPAAWKILDVEKLTSAPSGVVLTYEQTDVSHEALGQELPVGHVWVTFQLVLSTPETDAVKGMLRLTKALGPLLHVLDSSPDLRWTDATRLRFETGESGYIVPVAFLATNPAPPAP